MAVTFALALASHASGQEDWQRMVRNCYESRLINKEFYKANKDVMPDAAGRIPRLYLLSAMIAQISEVSEDHKATPTFPVFTSNTKKPPGT
jgi:hypothetical protein